MHSSTSSSSAAPGSNQQELRNSIALLLVAAVLLCLAFEFGARAFIYRLSASLGRMHAEAAAAQQMSGDGRPAGQVLLAGNSLLQAGIDVTVLNEGLYPDWLVNHFVVTQTTYLDWYFGMKRLLEQGSRPDRIIICIEPRHLIQKAVRHEIFAQYLMQLSDLPEVGRTLDLHPTDYTDFAMANISTAYALRKEIRKNILLQILPRLPDLTALITKADHPPPDSAELMRIGRERLVAGRDVAAANGASLLILFTPPVDPAQADMLKALGRELGVPVVVPLTDADLIEGDYDTDGYHLSAQGMERFTDAAVPLLRRALAERGPSTGTPR